MKTYRAIDVAKRFLELARDDAEAVQDISNMKLNKLCFFAQLVSICVNADAPIISDPFHAFDYGPVEPKLFRRIRKFGSISFSLLNEQVAAAFADAAAIDDPDALNIVNVVWNKFKTWTAVDLSRLTHRRNSPWSVVYSRQRYAVIPNAEIAKYKWGDPE